MIRKYAEIFCWKNVSSFCSAKATHIFSAKNIRILCIESAKTVNEMTLNKLVKLTTLWTTGPWSSVNRKGTWYTCRLQGRQLSFCDLVCFPAHQVPSEKGFTQKKRNCSHWEANFVNLFFRMDIKTILTNLPPLNVYAFSFKLLDSSVISRLQLNNRVQSTACVDTGYFLPKH